MEVGAVSNAFIPDISVRREDRALEYYQSLEIKEI